MIHFVNDEFKNFLISEFKEIHEAIADLRTRLAVTEEKLQEILEEIQRIWQSDTETQPAEIGAHEPFWHGRDKRRLKLHGKDLLLHHAKA